MVFFKLQNDFSKMEDQCHDVSVLWPLQCFKFHVEV